jgi:hypothetical protein
MAKTTIEEPSKGVRVKVKHAIMGAIGRITSPSYRNLLVLVTFNHKLVVLEGQEEDDVQLGDTCSDPEAIEIELLPEGSKVTIEV